MSSFTWPLTNQRTLRVRCSRHPDGNPRCAKTGAREKGRDIALPFSVRLHDNHRVGDSVDPLLVPVDVPVPLFPILPDGLLPDPELELPAPIPDEPERPVELLPVDVPVPLSPVFPD